MPNALLIAEKPDLMRKIQEVYDKHKNEIPYTATFTSQRGHLVTTLTPSEYDEMLKKWNWESLPIEPEKMGGWKYKVIKEEKQGNYLTSQERYEEIKKELKSGKYDFVIHAGDPDQEGELLVRLVLGMANNSLPVYRFWTNDLTEKHILNALINLKDDDRDPMLTNLLDAAYGRQHSDWRYGMNISRAASLKMNGKVNCGRVKTPILAIVCKRENEIRNFKPKTTYGVEVSYEEGFTGNLYDMIGTSDDNGNDAEKGLIYYDTKEEAESVIAKCSGIGSARVVSVENKRTEQYAPKLYKLATLQIDAGKLGYNDSLALATLQNLYEQGYLSYPRTDCEYLSSGEDFSGILRGLSSIREFAPYIATVEKEIIGKVRTSKKWVNDKELEEHGHSALRPTTQIPDFSKLSEVEKDIYMMVSRRFVAMFLPPMIRDKRMLLTEMGGNIFKSTGVKILDHGFATLFQSSSKDKIIPDHKQGDLIAIQTMGIKEKTSTCPKRYTSPDLIAVCENPIKELNDESLKKLGKRLKIGTPATRSAIIRQLIEKDKYLEEKKEKKTTYIVPTKTGEAIIKNLEGLQICRVDMTGEWEEKLEMVRSGEMSLTDLEDEMRQGVREMIEEIYNKEMNLVGNASTKKVLPFTCPRCGKLMYEGEKGYYCSGFKDGCKTSIFKESYGASFTANDFLSLAQGSHLNKNGREFYYDFASGVLKEMGKVTDIPCPLCGIQMESTGDYLRSACGFRTKKMVAGHTLSLNDFMSLKQKGMTEDIDDFVSSKGNKFKAKLTFQDQKLVFYFSSQETDILCPCCKKKYLKESDTRYSCECGFECMTHPAKRYLTHDELKVISEQGISECLDGFVSKKGTKFSAYLKLNKRKKTLGMEFKNG